MPIRFVLGRAGSGKTAHCIGAIRRHLADDPLRGPRLVLMVPEQAGLQMERAIMTPSPPVLGRVAAAHRAEVLSFQRLAARVLETGGGPTRVALTEPARVMVLRHVIARNADRLRYYRRVDRVGGFLDRLATTVMELIRENITPEALGEPGDATVDPRTSGFPALDRLPDSLPEPHQRAKLHDLRIIYAGYLEYLAEGRLDPAQHLEAARNQLARCSWLQDALLWVDGFASFTEQEMLTFLALARMCAQVDVTMLTEPRTVVADASDAHASARLFSRMEESLTRLRQRVRQAGLTELPPLSLSAPMAPRLTHSPSLQELERELFRPRTTTPARPPHNVELVELPTRRVEVEFAVARICDWVQDKKNPLRYRDVALVVRDLEPYHDFIVAALRSRNIPFFVDRRRPVGHHPLVEFLRSMVRIAAEDMSPESMRLLLKTDLLPYPRSAIDEIENYILACGIAGRAQWNLPWTIRNRGLDRSPRQAEAETASEIATGRLNHFRDAVLELLGPWLDFAVDPMGHTGKEWAAAIVAVLRRCGAERIVAEWAAGADTAGELDLAEEHEQTWLGVLSVIDDLGFALGDALVPADPLGDILATGFSSLTLGLAPPTIDQVLVGSIERSRHPDIAAAVILGFNDNVFPRRAAEDSILNDDDRDLLIGRGVMVTPGAQRRMLDESLLVYIAATRPSRHLVITYAAANEDGKALRPSPYVHDLRQALPGLSVQSIGDPVQSRSTWDMRGSGDLRRRIAQEFRSRRAAVADDQDFRRLWNGIYSASRLHLRNEPATRNALAALEEEDPARLTSATVERLFGAPFRTSISQLESYASCPFQFFARSGLQLRERAEAVLEPVDVGQVHHAILEHFSSELSRTGRGIGEISEADVYAYLGQSCRRVHSGMSPEGIFNARNAYILRRSGERLARVLQAQRRRCDGRVIRTASVELPFGFDLPGGLPALEISTPQQRKAYLRGYIDRVDLIEYLDEVLGIVIDYKTTRDRRLDLSAVYHGLSLQLPAYLLAIAESGRTPAGRSIRPAAGFYMSLASRYQLVDHPGRTSPRDDLLGGTFRPRGLLLGEALPALDSTECGWSQNYSAYRKKDGTYAETAGSDVACKEAFAAVLNHTRGRLGELADGVLDGKVPVSPVQNAGYTPCSWCGLNAACRVEIGIIDARYVERLKRTEVLSRIGGVALRPNAERS